MPGSLLCSIGRSIAGTAPQDFNLNGDFYILYGRRASNPSAGSLGSHVGPVPNPSVSITQYNPTQEVTVAPTVTTPSLPAGVTTPVGPILIRLSPAQLLFLPPQTKFGTDYNLVFREPAGCDPSACDIFVSIDTNQGNSDYLDIYMQGASQAWIAVGFTETPNMVSMK